MIKNNDFSDGNTQVSNNNYQPHCSCRNISFKVRNIQIDHLFAPPNNMITDNQNDKLKHNRHIYIIGYKSIYISDFSAVMAKQSASSLFHITCLICQDDFLIHSYEDHVIMKRLKKSHWHRLSFDKNHVNTTCNTKETMKYYFPLELRRFCTFGINYNDRGFNHFTHKSRNNEKNNRNIENNKRFIQELDITSSFEKEAKKIENSFEDQFGAIFYQDHDPVVGPYTASPVLNWNITNI